MVSTAGGYTHDFLFLFACEFTTIWNVFLKPNTDFRISFNFKKVTPLFCSIDSQP